MKLWTRLFSLAAVAAMLGVAFTPSSAGDIKKELSEFKKTWTDRRASTREKYEAVRALPTGNKDLADWYIDVLEGEVWQWRAEIMLQRLTTETDPDLLNELGKFLFDEKKAPKQASAAEHLILGLFNNSSFAKPERWARAGELIRNEKMPDKVKWRMIRELGRWRGAEDNPEVQTLMKNNCRLLIDLLGENLKAKRPELIARFLIIDSLESLTNEEHGDKIENWTFWYNDLKDKPLTPRKATMFKDDLGDIELEGHSFARKEPRKVEGMEILILPEFGYSEEYWYPYIFELNKTMTCTFVQLPDASRVKDLERPIDREGNKDPNAYFYPLEQLVEAFELRRQESKQKKVGIIAHGVSGWIALEYCRLHPESVAFAIIMNTWAGNNSYGKARNQLEGNKDDDLKYFGMGLLYDPTNRQGYGALTDDQKFHYETGAYKRMQHDPKAVEPVLYGAMREQFREQIGGGQALTPKFEFEDLVGRKTIDAHVMFVWGAHDPMYVDDDMKAFQKSFDRGKATFEIFPNSSRTPWAEEPTLFYEKFDQLIERSGVLKQEDK
ncbi:MAG: alpha/beta hydrolase [Planctomycetes bacterium]|nr:alpha/beta hydrolase [Planctomycetota bacterium]